MVTLPSTTNNIGGCDMYMYFKEFATYNGCLENSKSFVVSVSLRVRVGSDRNSRELYSSAIPNTPETREAVMTAIAMTAPEYKEPFCLWNGRSVIIIPADSIESIRIEFDLPRQH